VSLKTPLTLDRIRVLNSLKLELKELAAALVALGCPVGKSAEMAAQLDKRACQLSKEKRQSYEQTMTHLLSLMQQGWAAKERGL
jgi:hypothetical protein